MITGFKNEFHAEGLDLYEIDTLQLLRQVPDGSIDLLLQDTPFGCTQNEWDIKPDLPLMWPEWERVTKRNGAMIFFGTQPFASELVLSNLKNFRYDLIWYKPLGTGYLNASKMPMRNHEILLVFYRSLPTYNPQMEVGLRKKGRRKHDRNGTNYGKFAQEAMSNYFDDKGNRYPQSVIDFSNGDRTTESDHPNQKPLDLIRYLIKTYSNENETVFDGYFGSGTAAAACIEEKRKFIGSENKTDYFTNSINRVKNHLAQTAINF